MKAIIFTVGIITMFLGVPPQAKASENGNQITTAEEMLTCSALYRVSAKRLEGYNMPDAVEMIGDIANGWEFSGNILLYDQVADPEKYTAERLNSAMTYARAISTAQPNISAFGEFIAESCDHHKDTVSNIVQKWRKEVNALK